MVCTVCHFILFKNWLKHIFVPTACMWEAASPLYNSAHCRWECSDRICCDHRVFQLVPVSHSSYKERVLVLLSPAVWNFEATGVANFVSGDGVVRITISAENIIAEGKRSIKAAEKDPSATVVACVRSAGATAVGSVNATEFWQRRTRPPSFLPLLSCKMDRAIPQWSTLRRGSQMIYYHYRFCDNYFSSRIIHWCAVFHRKKTRTKLRLFQGCSDKIK